MAWLIREHWEGAHPRAEGGDYSTRLGQLMALEDNAVVLLPLQYARLLELPREGSFSLPRPAGGHRRRQAALGHALQHHDRRERRPASTRNSCRRSRSRRFCATSRSKSSRPWPTHCAALRRRCSLSGRPPPNMSASSRRSSFRSSASSSARWPSSRGARSSRAIRRVAPAPEPAAGAEGEGEAAPSAAAPSSFATRADVDAALGSALGYFVASEPTSPALLLIRQARVMLGKNLYQVMQLLAPPHADNARVSVGPDGAFTVPVRDSGRRPQRRSHERGVSARFVARGGAGADRRRLPAHAARRAFQSCSVSARAGEEPRLARLRQPAPRRPVRGRDRLAQEGRVRVICRAR